MSTYGVRYVDARGVQKIKEFKTEKARRAWVYKHTDVGAPRSVEYVEVLAYSDPEETR